MSPDTQLTFQTPPRLSVLICAMRPAIPLPLFQRPHTLDCLEKTLDSLFSQLGPLPFEVIALLDGGWGRSNGVDEKKYRLEDKFRPQLKNQSLIFVPLDRWHGFRMPLWIEGASRAQGAFLAFGEAGDIWKPGRLSTIQEQLSGHDLLFNLREPLPESADLFRSYLENARLIQGSVVIRRPLYDQASKKLSMMPVALDFELTVKAMALLLPEKIARARALDSRFSVDSIGIEGSLNSVGKNITTESLISGISLLQSAPSIPMRYWISSTERAREWGDRLGSQVKKRVMPEIKVGADRLFDRAKSQMKSVLLRRK